jgi:hypothetical protein
VLQDPRPASDALPLPGLRPPSRRRWTWKQRSLTVVLGLLLLSSMLTGIVTVSALAASTASASGAKGGLALKQFLAQKRPDGVYHGSVQKPKKIPLVPTSSKEQGTLVARRGLPERLPVEPAVHHP